MKIVEDVFIEFKVGQKWKTRMGNTFLIKDIKEGEEYPIVCISMDNGKKYFFDEDGFEVAYYPTDNDLVENISL